MKINFEKNTVKDGYGNWKILEKQNDCYIAQGYGNINKEEYAYNIGFRDQHISVMRMLPDHFYDLSLAVINTIKQLPDDSEQPKLTELKKLIK